MGLRVFIPKETAKNEHRVAASPETVKKLIAIGCDLYVQSGAGEEASFRDADYKNAGAKIEKSVADAVKKANAVLCVQPPSEEIIKNMGKDSLLVGILNPYKSKDTLTTWAKAGIVACAMDLMPRITRAQNMDVLSSQSNLTGYKAILDAAEHYTRAFPMMMTAAGTIPPAKVFVMGAGVAGLQAIATAKRLGAVVTATDVRPAAREQVESLGANFIAVENEEFKNAESAGGYAKEMSKDYQKKQAALIEEHIAKQDIVITTALIPGRPAPTLISEAMVKSMKPGSVIVDLAVESGGNCALSECGKVVDEGGVTIVGHENVASRLATDSSALYARNLLNFMTLITDQESKTIEINWDDDIIKSIALTRGGKIIHPDFAQKKATPKKTASK